MAFYQIDQDKNYMREMWGTTQLITDYQSVTPQKRIIQEVMALQGRNHDIFCRAC